MTGDCMGDLESPPDCAADITSFMEPWQRVGWNDEREAQDETCCFFDIKTVDHHLEHSRITDGFWPNSMEHPEANTLDAAQAAAALSMACAGEVTDCVTRRYDRWVVVPALPLNRISGYINCLHE